MAFAARRQARAAGVSNERLMRLVRFPSIRNAISKSLARAVPEKVETGHGGAYVRFRLADPKAFHPALFATIPVGSRGTLLVIGTRRTAVKQPARLAAFMKRMGKSGLKSEARRSLIYQLRAAGIIGGSETQAVLVPKSRVLSAAAMYASSSQGRAAANPILATIGFNPGRRAGARRNAYACYKCGKQIKGEVTHHVPPVLHERLGIDFPKAFHARCYKEWQDEAGRELGIKKNAGRIGSCDSCGRKNRTLYQRTDYPGVRTRKGLRSPWLCKDCGGPWSSSKHRRGQRRNPLTTKESVDLLRHAKYMEDRARRTDKATAAAYYSGEARGLARAVQRYGIKRAGRVADRLGGRSGETAFAKGAYSNPGAVEIKVPFRDGQKITPARMRQWIDSLPDNAITRLIKRRFEKAMSQYKRFHLGAEPTSFTYRAIPMGSQGSRITDVDMVVSEGKEWAAPYQVPKSSGKYDARVQGRYIHAHGESKMDVDIKKAAHTSRLPERFHTADGKFVGVVPSRNVKITDWYRG